MLALSGVADRAGVPRRSPVEIIATMGLYVTRTPALPAPLGRQVRLRLLPPSQAGYRDWSRALLDAVASNLTDRLRAARPSA
jgi:hypothetical protein